MYNAILSQYVIERYLEGYRIEKSLYDKLIKHLDKEKVKQWFLEGQNYICTSSGQLVFVEY